MYLSFSEKGRVQPDDQSHGLQAHNTTNRIAQHKPVGSPRSLWGADSQGVL